MPNPILEQARARLTAIAAERAALDKEERELRAMVAAAEGAVAAPLAPWPTINPSLPLPCPPFVPAPDPFIPWIVKGDHGGMCACPACVPRITCGDGRASMGGTVLIGDVGPNVGSTMAAAAIYLDPTCNANAVQSLS